MRCCRTLLDTILASIQPSFRLAKVEGDAIFAVEAETIPRGEAVLGRLRSSYGTSGRTSRPRATRGRVRATPVCGSEAST